MRPSLSIRKVHAMRGKFIRAEPVAILMEQERIHHAGSAAEFEALEDELCNVTSGSSSRWEPGPVAGQ